MQVMPIIKPTLPTFREFEELVRHGKSQGRLLAERWEGEWQRDMQKLIAHTSYRLPQAA